MKMPEKNSEVWLIMLAWCQQHFNTIYTFLLSVMIAIFRICYIGKEKNKRRVVCESVLIGLIAISSNSVFTYFNMPEDLSVGLGAVLATFGMDKVRAIAFRYVDKKVGNDEQL